MKKLTIYFLLTDIILNFNILSAQEVADKCNFWVFDLESSRDIRLEKYEEEYSRRNSTLINRITPE